MKKALALILAILMLSSTLVFTTTAAEPTNWEEVTGSLGLNTYIGGKIETPPVLDGVVEDDEYTLTIESTGSLAQNGGEIQSSVVEHFAYDSDYFYYASEYTQANDDRSFQFQWIPFNTFDIYMHTSGTDASYYQRVNTHIRYLSDGTLSELGYKLNYTTATASPVTNTDVFYAFGKDANNVKTHEVKISLDYIATAAGCAKSDVKVIPYFMYAHTSGAGGHAYTAGDKATLTAAGASFTPKENEWGYKFIVLGNNPKLAAPVLDGVVNKGEYATSRVFKKADMKNPTSTEIQSDVTEYFSHNSDYIYYALTFKQETEDNHAVIPNMKFINTFDIFNYHIGYDNHYHSRFTFQIRHRTTSDSIYHSQATVFDRTVPSDFDTAPILGKHILAATGYDADTQIKTYEIKIAKSYIANALGIEKSEIRVIPYFTTFHDSCYISPVFTEQDIADIAAAGSDIGAWANPIKVGDAGYYFMVLDTEPTEEESDWGKFAQKKGWNVYLGNPIADELPTVDNSTDWEKITHDAGLNTYIGKPMEVSPIVDGVVRENEYTYSRVVETSDIYGYAGGEIQSAVTEYFAHDADWVYYAASFTQANDGRAFQWKFNPFNTFDVFNATVAPITNAYDAYINWQVRYNPVYTTPPLVNYDGSWGPSLSKAGYAYNKNAPIQYPTIYKTVTGTQDEELVARASKTDDNVKTYEVKISKEYLANVNQCSKEDIRVIPYFTAFYDAAFIGQIYDATAIEKIKAADSTAVVPTEGSYGYNFIVLDEDPAIFKDDAMKSTLENLDLLTYVGAPMEVSPVVDGVVNPGEYSYCKTWAPEEIINFSAEIQSGVAEYIAHDADYVYYATVVKQEANDRAFQFYFRPFNSYDIFQSGTHGGNTNVHIYQKINWQIRYQDDGSVKLTPAPEWWYSDTEIAAPTTGENQDIEYAVKKTEANVKTYEIKIKKAYLATVNDCEPGDINVIPYMTYFHSGPVLAHKYTTKDAAAIQAVKPGAVVPLADNYRFIVLEEAPNGVEVMNPVGNLDTATKDGASVRLSATNSGLRFKTTVNTAELNALIAKYGKENLQVGTLIAPADILGNKALTIDTETKIDVVATIDKPFEDNGVTTTFAGSITNIKETNLDRDFTAVGYIAYTVDGTNWIYIYSAATCTRNVTEIAQAAVDAKEFEGDTVALGILEKLGAVLPDPEESEEPAAN